MFDVMDKVLGLHLNELEWNHMMVRSVVVFLYAIILMRIAGMRTFGTKSAFDIVFGITIGAILGRAIMGHYSFFATLLAALSFSLCHRVISYLSRFPSIKKWTEGQAVCLYENGNMMTEKFQQYSIKPEDIDRALRGVGLETLDKVKKIWFEVDGKINIIQYNK